MRLVRKVLFAGAITSAIGLAWWGFRPVPAPRGVSGCPTWTLAADGACRPRGWTLPAPSDGLGGSGLQLRDLALDGRGLGVAVWQVESSGRSRVEIGEELEPGRWSAQLPATADAGQEGSPALAAGPDRFALVAWVHAGEGSVVVTRERDGSGEWRDGPTLSIPPGAVEPAVAVSPGGEQLVAWCQATATGWGVAVAQRDQPGAEWHRPSGVEDVVSPRILFANQPRVAVNARGDALVTWYQSEGVPLMTYVSERSGGGFSHPDAGDHLSAPGAPVASDPIANPKAAVGPDGEAAVVWVQENGAGATPVYLATRDAKGVWLKPRDLSDAFSRASGLARTARVAFGPGGELYVTWAQRDGTGAAVYAARRGADGRWLETGRDPMRLSSGLTAYEPVLAVGPQGGALAAWVEQDASGHERIAVRRTGFDRPGWEPTDLLTGADGGHVAFLQAAIGKGDRALVGWVAGLAQVRVVFARVD